MKAFYLKKIMIGIGLSLFISSSSYCIEEELELLHERLTQLKESTTQLHAYLRGVAERLETLKTRLLSLKQQLAEQGIGDAEIKAASTAGYVPGFVSFFGPSVEDPSIPEGPSIFSACSPFTSSCAADASIPLGEQIPCPEAGVTPAMASGETLGSPVSDEKKEDKDDKDLRNLFSKITISPDEDMSLGAFAEYIQTLEKQINALEALLKKTSESKDSKESEEYVKQRQDLHILYLKKLTDITTVIEKYQSNHSELENKTVLNLDFKTPEKDAIHVLNYLKQTCENFLHKIIDQYKQQDLLLTDYLSFPENSFKTVKQALKSSENLCRRNIARKNGSIQENNENLKSIARVLIIKLLQEKIRSYTQQALNKLQEERTKIAAGQFPEAMSDEFEA